MKHSDPTNLAELAIRRNMSWEERFDLLYSWVVGWRAQIPKGDPRRAVLGAVKMRITELYAEAGREVPDAKE